MMSDSIRSPFAGSWYSADPAELKTFFAEAAGEVKSDPGTVALILPHAGYVLFRDGCGAGGRQRCADCGSNG